jgi:hypothetical protein
MADTERVEVISVLFGNSVLTARGVVQVSDSLERMSPVDQGDHILITEIGGKWVAVSKTN